MPSKNMKSITRKVPRYIRSAGFQLSTWFVAVNQAKETLNRNYYRLIDWCFTARQHKIGQFVPIYQGGLLAHAFEDSQRATYKNIQLHAIQWTYTSNDKQQVCLTCLKINNAYNKLHDPEWVKNAGDYSEDGGIASIIQTESDIHGLYIINPPG